MKSKSISRPVVACSILVASLASLGLPRRAGAFQPPVDPCSVLTQQEVSSALGEKTTAGEHVVATLCESHVSGPASSGRHKRLTVGFLNSSAWEQTKAMRESIPGFTRTPINGLGEEAVFSASPSICTLAVKKGAAMLELHLYAFAPDEAKARAVLLARAALERF